MSEPIIINLHDNRGRAWANWLGFIATLSFLAFCIWLSQGSTWWTFITGVLFLLVFFVRLAHVARANTTVFRGLDELHAWLDQQRVIEALPPGEIIVEPPTWNKD